MPGLRDAAVDLLLGGRCVGCERPGRVLCRTCAHTLPDHAEPCWPDPTPAGLVTPFCATTYDGLVRSMVIGHKEHALVALRPALSGLLAVAATAALVDARVPPATAVVLVPVPSRRASIRARGHDPTRALTEGAARVLQHAGARSLVAPLLRLRAGVVDQAGLDRSERSANLSGSMAASSRGLRRLAVAAGDAVVVVCDDVLTTGSTAREAQRALESVGVRVLAVACVAATARRSPGRGQVPESSSAVLSSYPPRD